MSNIPSIADFGASTASPDNTTAIQNALDSGPEIYIPGGSYDTRPLVAPASLVKLWGPGTLVGVGTPAAPLLTIADHGFAAPMLLEGIGISLPSSYAGVNAITSGKTALQARGLNISGGLRAIWINGAADLSTAAVGIDDCFISGFSESAIVINNPNVAWVRRNTISGNPNARGHTVLVSGGSDVTLRDNSVYGGSVFGTYFVGVTRGQIHGNYRATPIEAIVIDSCVDVSIESGTKLGWAAGESRDFAISVGASQAGLPLRNCSIVGVTIRGCGKSGIYVGNGSGAGAGVKGFLIEGGSIVDANQLGASNPTPAFSDGVTIGGDGNEAGITNTRIFGLTVANDRHNNIVYGVHEQSASSGAPSTTKVTGLNAVGLVAPQLLMKNNGSSVQYPQYPPLQS